MTLLRRFAFAPSTALQAPFRTFDMRVSENLQTVYSPADSISHDDRIELLAGVLGHPHPDAGRHGDHEDGDA